MWGFDDLGWGLGMLLWMVAVWAVVLITVAIIFHDISGPKHHTHH